MLKSLTASLNSTHYHRFNSNPMGSIVDYLTDDNPILESNSNLIDRKCFNSHLFMRNTFKTNHKALVKKVAHHIKTGSSMQTVFSSILIPPATHYNGVRSLLYKIISLTHLKSK